MNCARCTWRSTPDADASAQLVEHAVSAGHPLCPVPRPTHSDADAVCGRSLASTDPTHACEGCLTQVRADLAVIRDLFAELPQHLRTVAGSALGGARGGDGRPLPGGTVLALLARGNHGGEARRLTAQMPAHLRTEVDVMRDAEGREHRVDNRADDTASVHWSLMTWCVDWTEMRGEVA